MELMEKTVDSRVVYDGGIVRLRVDRALLPNGHTASREVVEHPGGVGVVAVDEEGRVLMVRQFRYPLGRTFLEIPAGKLDRGEDPLAAARRELEEETGARAGRWTDLGRLYVSPGFCDEAIHLYLARELSFVPSHPDEDEFLAVERIPLSQLAEMAMDGRMEDGKSVAGVLKTVLYKGE